jgi:hypothetical protein
MCFPRPRKPRRAADATGRRLTRRRKLGLAGALLLGIGAAGLVAARGGVTTFDGVDWSHAPAWASPCRGQTPRRDRRLLARCSRASGLVVWVRRKGPAAAPTEVHFAMLAGFHPLLVKLDDPRVQQAPGLGHRVTIVGALVRASNGMREIQAWSVE